MSDRRSCIVATTARSSQRQPSALASCFASAHPALRVLPPSVPFRSGACLGYLPCCLSCRASDTKKRSRFPDSVDLRSAVSFIGSVACARQRANYLYEASFGFALLLARDMPILDSGTARSEERRVGKECVRTCRSRWAPYH